MTKLSGHGRSASALSPTKIRDSVATRPADIASAVASTGLIRANSTAFQASSTSRSSSASKQSVTGISSTNTTTMIETAMTTSLHIEKSSTLLCPPSSQIHPDSHHQKQSPWFWRRKAASLVRSASTAKGKNDGAPGWGSSDKPPTDEAYESKTSTLSSAVTVDGVDRPLLIESISVTRSASTRETKAGKKGFLVRDILYIYIYISSLLKREREDTHWLIIQRIQLFVNNTKDNRLYADLYISSLRFNFN